MEEMFRIINNNIVAILLLLAGFACVLLILIIILFVKNKSLKRKYKTFMQGTDTDIESLLIESIKKTEQVQVSHRQLEQSITSVQTQLQSCIQKVATVRYNAISDVGADLSFAVALLDEKDNGLVINGIYTRDGSYTYAKPIQKGESSHELSDEEEEAIRNAKQLS